LTQGGEQTLDLSIIIVNWKSVDFLQACLTAIYKNVRGISFEVLVIDNASFDGSIELLRQRFPDVVAIQSQENMGFARANNYCFAQSKGENVLFLNPDTEIVGPALQTMVHYLQNTPGVGAVGPKLLNSDRSVQTSCIQRFPTILNQLLDSEELRRRFPSSSLWGMGPLMSASPQPASVDAISGACLMVKRNIFAEAGRFDEGYFMYSEDVDLCFKVRKRGFRTCYIPTALVMHHGGQSSASHPQSHFAAIMTRESLFRFMWRQYGPVYACTYRTTVALAAIIRLLLIAILVVRKRDHKREQFKAAFLRWFQLLAWAFGLSAGNKSLGPGIVRSVNA
jgi:GT2 family glycosyltransferase